MLHPWNINACPMSGMAFSEADGKVEGAWETAGQVYFEDLTDSPAPAQLFETARISIPPERDPGPQVLPTIEDAIPDANERRPAARQAFPTVPSKRHREFLFSRLAFCKEIFVFGCSHCE
jgi:hypothetical protein